MDNGIHDLADEEYFAADGLNNSYLWKLINQTPAHAQVPTPKTDAMTMGSAVHLAVLQPELANTQIVQGPDSRRGKKWTDAIKEAEADGKILLTQADYNKCMSMRDSVWKNPACASELNHTGTVYEHAAFYKMPWVDVTGEKIFINCKCKVDAARGATIIDLKTSQDASPRAFTQSVAKYGYHQQDAFYSKVWGQAANVNIDTFLFLVVEKHPPFACAIYELDTMSKREGVKSYKEAISEHNFCERRREFPAYATEKVLLQLPAWAFKHTNPRSIQLVNNGGE